MLVGEHEAVPEVAATPRCKELLLRPRLFEGAYERSVFTVDSFASTAECQALVDAAHRLLDSYGNAHVQPARSRLSIVSRIDQVLRLRLLTLLEAELPDFAHSIFGQSTGLAELRPDYSPGELAVNIYTTGGEFAPHTDKQSVTLLVPLSAADAFKGGGTAFWPESHLGADDDKAYDENCRSNWLPHTHKLSPPAGTAIIFGGDVTHAGLPVTSGTRHLFVMSFTLRPRAPRAAKPTQTDDPDFAPEGYLTAKASSATPSEHDAADEDALGGLADFADLFGAE